MPHPPDHDDRLEKSLMLAAVGSGAVAALIGAGHLVVMLTGAMAHVDLHPSDMKTNTSLCFLLCGTAFALAVRRDPGKVRRWSARAMAAVALAIAVLTLAEHLFQVDFGIDQLLAEGKVNELGVPYPNRMGPPGAVSVTLCAVAILLLQDKKPRAWLVQRVGITLFLIALLGFLGHLYHVRGFYAVPRLTSIALPTALAILLLGVGLLLARPRQAIMATFTSGTPGGIAARRLLVPAIVLPILLGWLVLQGVWHGLYGVSFGTSLLVLSWIVIFSILVYRTASRAEVQQKVAEDQRTREALRESEQRLRSIIDNMTEGLVVADPGSGALHWNRTALAMYQYQEEVDGICFLDELAETFELKTLDGAVVPQEQWPVRRILGGEELHDLDLVVRDKKRNRQRIYSYSGVLTRDPAGEPQMGLLTVRDITDRKLAEDALRESEEKFRAVFQQAAVGMGRVRFSDARWIDVNDAFCGMLGYSREEMCSTPWPEITHPDDLDLDLIPFRRMAAGELENYSVEKRFIHKQGHQVWARLTLSLVRDAHGQPGYEVAIIEDITARKEAEEALRRAKDELELRVRERTGELERAYLDLQRETEERLAAVEDLREKEQLLVRQTRLAAMGEMLGNIAHQWRQPLNVLGLLIQQLQLSYDRGKLSGEFLKGEVAKGMNLIRHMSQTIDDFKDFLKEEKETQLFSVNGAVLATVSLLEAQLKALGVELEIEQYEELWINGHRNEFSHVVLNLITNARDAFRERNVAAPKIVISIFKEQGKPVVTVTDNAGGIPEEILPRIFEPYFTTKGPDKGTGIGLYMSKNIIEKSMGGRLSVTNTEQGAQFRMEF